MFWKCLLKTWISKLKVSLSYLNPSFIVSIICIWTCFSLICCRFGPKGPKPSYTNYEIEQLPLIKPNWTLPSSICYYNVQSGNVLIIVCQTDVFQTFIHWVRAKPATIILASSLSPCDNWFTSNKRSTINIWKSHLLTTIDWSGA